MPNKTLMNKMDLIADEIEHVKDEAEECNPKVDALLDNLDRTLDQIDVMMREAFRDKPLKLAEWEELMRRRAEVNANCKFAEDLKRSEVRPSNIQGRGLFAVRAFAPEEIVLRWDTSHLISRDEVSTLDEDERRYLHPYDNDRLIRVQPPERYVNHSCDNNTEVRDFCDVAIRVISPGEEITSNYAADGSGSKFACFCGARNCRGSIG
jgi:SET domain